ncbi:MAG: c-type cytochrome [Pseudomonadota bacterium]|nr:c-type cytochrome [Pseudomonadota bacterium]
MTLRILIAAFASALLSTAVVAQDMAAPATTTEAAPAVVPAPDAKALLAELALAKPGDVKAGADKATVCAACHGLDGNSSDPQYPKLAGQHEHFIATQLVAYKSGTRPNVVMASFASMLSAQDMRDVGAYFSTQTIVPGLADESPIAAALSPYKGQRVVDVGRNIYRGGIKQSDVPACMACHGPSGVGNPGPGYPALGGQHSGYVGTVLTGYKAVPAGDPRLENANYAIMATIAQRLSDEEILAVSSYIEGLHARNMNSTAQSKP